MVPTCVPAGDMCDEVFFEHEAPPLDHIEQSLPEGPHIHSEPLVKDGRAGNLLQFCIHLLIGVNLLFKLVQSWRCLGNTLITCLLHLLRAQNMAIQEKLLHEDLTVVYPKIGVLVKGLLEVSALVHDRADVAHQLISQVRQFGNLFHIHL